MSTLSMFKTLFKNISKKSSTVLYPVAGKPVFERERGQINVDIDKCTLCTMCARKCPTGAITVDRTEKFWSIDRLLCIQCNCCAEVCPQKCLTMDTKRPDAALSKDGEAVCTSTK